MKKVSRYKNEVREAEKAQLDLLQQNAAQSERGIAERVARERRSCLTPSAHLSPPKQNEIHNLECMKRRHLITAGCA